VGHQADFGAVFQPLGVYLHRVGASPLRGADRFSGFGLRPLAGSTHVLDHPDEATKEHAEKRPREDRGGKRVCHVLSGDELHHQGQADQRYREPEDDPTPNGFRHAQVFVFVVPGLFAHVGWLPDAACGVSLPHDRARR
jgi:hypothetical protein